MIISHAHGKCLEGWSRAREALEAALIVCKVRGIHPDSDAPEAVEVRACGKDMADWSALARETPIFVEVAP